MLNFFFKVLQVFNDLYIITAAASLGRNIHARELLNVSIIL